MKNGNIIHTVDFRSIYATISENGWLWTMKKY